MTGKINFNIIQNYNKISGGLRLFFSIFCLAQRVYQKNVATFDNIVLSQKDFASSLDITRQTVSKRLDTLENAGIITYRLGKLTINKFFFDGDNIDVTAIKNFKGLNTGVQLLLIILLCTLPNGRTNINKKKFAEYLHITPQSAGIYLRELVQANVIKYKYSGDIAINPDFFYTGENKDLNDVRQNYIKFKSNM